MTKVLSILICFVTFSSSFAFASGVPEVKNQREISQQTKNILKGKVVDSKGVALPGVTVLIKGTTKGVATDMDGNYTITFTESNPTIVFSFIGMQKKEFLYTGQKTLNVTLSDDTEEMEEVVVVAYGSQKKESLTGAISTVSTKAIEKRAVTSVSSVLEGETSGVQVNNSYGEPGADATIRIRGFTSINGSNSPLYVVDGVPFGGNMSDLNPSDIKSISVLKDAASAALYGNRAANGVILITTKSGASDQVRLRFSVNQGIYNRGIKDYDRLGTDEWMEAMWKGYRNSLVTAGSTIEEANAKASSNLIKTYLKYNVYDKADDEVFDNNGNVVAKMRDGFKDDLDWNDDIERLGWRQDYNLSADVASEKFSCFFSIGYLDEDGYVKTSDFNRMTARANVSITPRKWLKVGLNMTGSHQNSNSTAGTTDDNNSFVNPFFYGRTMSPIYPVHLHDMTTGEYILDDNGNKIYDDGDANGRPQYLGRHVVWESELDQDKTLKNTLNAQVFMNISFLKDFKFILKGDVNVRNLENREYSNSTIGDGAGLGRAKKAIYNYKNYTSQQQLTWNKSYDLHNIDALVAHENYSYNRKYTYGFKTTEIYSGVNEFNNFTEVNSLDGYSDNYKTESFLGRIRYNYDNKYFAEASFRRDGSSRFHKDTRWGNFWSVGGSWMISKEEFMYNLEDKINSLKLRASYGEVGNDAGAGYYSYMSLYYSDQNGKQAATYRSQLPANNLKWETTSSFGVALEGRFFNRLNLTIEYFDKRSKDLLFDVYFPLSSGATSSSSAEATVTQNLGTVSNKGLEITADYNIIANNTWKWNFGFNANFLNNEILKLPEENRENGIINGSKRYLEGHGIYDFWLYQFVGVDQMNGEALYEIDPSKETPSEYVREINGETYTTNTSYGLKDWSGSVIPDVYGSFNTSLSWNNFSFSVMCTYSLGGKTLDYTYSDLMSVTTNPSAIHKDILKSWDGVPEGITETSANRIDPNGVPQINYTLSQYNNATSTRFLQDADYLVIKNVSLSYMFPENICNKLDLKGLTLNLGIDNLATFTKLQGMNPQQSFSGTNQNAFVTARVYTLGLRVNL